MKSIPRKNNRRWTIAGAVGLVLLIAALGGYYLAFDSAEFRHRPENGSVAATEPSFVGSDRCAECHVEIADSYRRSGMGRSFQKVTTSSLPELPAELTDAQGQFRYQLVMNDGKFVQQEFPVQPATSMPIRERLAAYQIGSGDHAAAFLWEQNEYLGLLPAAWYADRGAWGLNPGYELKNHRFDRIVRAGCISCHGSTAEQDKPAPNRFHQPLSTGIRCERCHGPGSDHVSRWSHASQTNSGSADATMVNPARLAADRANDVCLQCHLTGDVTLYPPGRDEFSFRPGDRLADHRLDWQVETGEDESFGVASHGVRMMLSRCYTATGGKLQCIACHDVHQPLHDTPRDRYDSVCASCHQPAACKRPDPAEVGCVRCHMPQRPTREGQHLVYTDHFIRRRPPQQFPQPSILPANADVASLKLITPDAESSAEWEGRAQVQLHFSLTPQFPSLGRGVAALSTLDRSGKLSRPGRRSLAVGLVAMKETDRSLKLLTQLLEEAPQDLELKLQRAMVWDQRRDYDRAIAEYESILGDAPQWLEPYPLLIRLYLSRGETKQVHAWLDRQSAQFPLDAVGWTQRALAWRLQREPAEKIQSALRTALELDPSSVLAWLAQAELAQAERQFDAAERSYRRALKLEPNHPVAGEALRKLQILRKSGNP